MSNSDAAMAAMGGVVVVYYILIIALCALTIIGQWKIFSKAGVGGWKAIVPGLNLWTLFQIVYGSGARMFMIFIPVFGEIYTYMTLFRLAKVFGKNGGFGVGMIFLTPIFEIILGFDKSEYAGALYS